MTTFHLKVIISEVQSDTKKGLQAVHPIFRNGTHSNTKKGRQTRPPIFRNGTVAQGSNIYPNEINLPTRGDYSIVANMIIKSKNGITTLRANLNKSINVVVKFAVGEAQARLLSQAQYYRNELKELQGSHIPILYGVFVGDVQAPAECSLNKTADTNHSDSMTAFQRLDTFSVLQHIFYVLNLFGLQLFPPPLL
ncbi:hypothetical protein BDZ94DRAFT_1313147 [Collybia nuda]|uniref:Uncharacterized protein n=1 Tax=Collybia nuda TaxID=64659 RepID=A0A9P5XZM8_9AGAR|nr:hypothetical protein BDZ94DRAFT_1313147 [Collybia nuda]